MSLAVPAVYSIPMLLLVGWRGEPGKRDEPQHLHQGQATPGLLGEVITCTCMAYFAIIINSRTSLCFFFKVTEHSKLMGGLIELKVGFLGWNGLTIVCIFFIASCGIPFQVLPDYQEGAEQVSPSLVNVR